MNEVVDTQFLNFEVFELVTEWNILIHDYEHSILLAEPHLIGLVFIVH
jgi:hypothetical protein